MLTVDAFLIVAAFIVTIVSAAGKAPLWVAVLLLTLLAMLELFGR